MVIPPLLTTKIINFRQVFDLAWWKDCNLKQAAFVHSCSLHVTSYYIINKTLTLTIFPFPSNDNGKTWQDWNEKVNNETFRQEDGLQRNPHNPEIVCNFIRCFIFKNFFI